MCIRDSFDVKNSNFSPAHMAITIYHAYKYDDRLYESQNLNRALSMAIQEDDLDMKYHRNWNSCNLSLIHI